MPGQLVSVHRDYSQIGDLLHVIHSCRVGASIKESRPGGAPWTGGHRALEEEDGGSAVRRSCLEAILRAGRARSAQWAPWALVALTAQRLPAASCCAGQGSFGLG